MVGYIIVGRVSPRDNSQLTQFYYLGVTRQLVVVNMSGYAIANPTYKKITVH